MGGVTLALVLMGVSGGQTAKAPPEERALAYLTREVPRWQRENRCYSCHNNGDGARALYVALRLGYRIDPRVLADTSRWLAHPGEWAHNRGDPAFKDRKLAELQFAATLAEGRRAGAITDRKALPRAAQMLIAAQNKEGAWPIDTGGSVGAPVTYGTALATHLACRTLRQAGARRYEKELQRAGEWFRTVKVKTVLDAASVLWALAGASDDRARAQRQHCLTLIRKGESKTGGWGPYVLSAPEVFDSAVVLLALAAVPATKEIQDMIQRGRRYLIAGQEKEGGWQETTRPSGMVSYAQQVSTSAWATWALLATRPG
jgi:hypothetical protein